MKQPTTFWTQQLAVQDGQYVKVLSRRSAEGAIRIEAAPLFCLTRPGARYPDVNWREESLSPGKYVPFDGWVRMDPQSLRLAPMGTSFPVPIGPKNPLYLFNAGRRVLVADSVSLVQRLVALREDLFTILMSPFRELVARGRREAGVASIAVSLSRFGDLGTNTKQRRSLWSDEMASCLAYWTSNSVRTAELARCSASILRGEPLAVPKMQCSLSLRVRGLSDGRVTYVQSLMPAKGDSASHDLLWRDGWTSIRMVQTERPRGVEIFDRVPEVPPLCDASGTCRRRDLTTDEVEGVRSATRR